MSRTFPFTVTADGHQSRFASGEQAQAFAAMVSDEQMTTAEVHLARGGAGDGIVGQYVNGDPTPEFAGREDAVHRRSAREARQERPTPCTPTTSKTVRYTVEGRGEFPLDMLRHDEAEPSDEDAVHKIAASRTGEYFHTMVRVRLETNAPRFAPNVKRWESFGWRVVACDNPDRVSEPRAPRAAAVVEPEPREAGAITLRPTWAGVLRLLVEVATKGDSAEGRAAAWAELERMAKVADSAVARGGEPPKGAGEG